jgi:peptidoglycan hydrolase CwlO-like protein
VLVEVQTSQQVGKPTERGEVFETLVIPFSASATLDKVVWKGNEYIEQLRAEQENLKSTKAELEKSIEQLQAKILDGRATEADRKERAEYETELGKCKMRIPEIERVLEKLPAAYQEISQNESARLHYSVFLESEGEKRKLLILTTDM